MAGKRQKKLEYFFAKVSTPAPKRLIIESNKGGTHSITSMMSSDDLIVVTLKVMAIVVTVQTLALSQKQVLVYKTAKSNYIQNRVVEHLQVATIKASHG